MFIDSNASLIEISATLTMQSNSTEYTPARDVTGSEANLKYLRFWQAYDKQQRARALRLRTNWYGNCPVVLGSPSRLPS